MYRLWGKVEPCQFMKGEKRFSQICAEEFFFVGLFDSYYIIAKLNSFIRYQMLAQLHTCQRGRDDLRAGALVQDFSRRDSQSKLCKAVVFRPYDRIL